MSSVEDLLATQEQISTAIEQLFTNFKKDGADRKTAEYIKRRLDTLDSYWHEYQSNHMKLCGLAIKSHSYFTSNQFELTKDRFFSIRGVIENYQAREESRPSTPLIKPATPLGIPSGQPSLGQGSSAQSRGINSKTDEMLRKQCSNFKAFEHTISNINFDELSEKWQFEHILHSIETRWSAIDSAHWDLDSELGGRDPNYEATFFKYERQYKDIIATINKKRGSVTHTEQSTPQLEVPTFSGNYHQWISFKDLFTESIHRNPTLSDAQRMQFLKSKVRGEAERLIQHLSISSDNYSVCWQILNHRYDNNRLILNSLIDLILDIPVVPRGSLYHIKKMHDTLLESLNAIKNLGVDVDAWDPLVIRLLCLKLDSDTENRYIASVKNKREIPNLKEFLAYLETTFITLESTSRKQTNKSVMRNSNQNYQANPGHKYHTPNNFNAKHLTSTQSRNTLHIGNTKNAHLTKFYKCAICKTNDHGIFHCQQFLQMPPIHKRKTVSNLNLCQNCLYCHQGKECISNKTCRECNQMHNTLLHDAFVQSDQSSKPKQAVRTNTHVSQQDIPEVLLATAMVKVQTSDGSYLNMRALLDQGSQASLITENAAQLLGLQRRKCQGVIFGVGAKESNCKGLMHITCSAVNNNFHFDTDVYIMQNLIKNLPSQSFTKPSWSFLDNLTLADPELNTSRPIDLLLGADIYSLVLLDGICRGDQVSPIAQNTRLGWILSGSARTLQCNIVLNDIEQIQKFWEIEDISEESNISSAEQQCIEYYKQTTTRRDDGRYVVRLPMKIDFEKDLGSSKSKAIAQFRTLERKFIQQKNMENEYKLFMQEYQLLGHMQLAAGNTKPECHMTHHSVQRTESTTTKFRVVFNGSVKTSSGHSLNDVMQCGPNLQQDLQSLIIKWRQYRYAFTADIEKMFRQIWIHEEDQKLQKIVWRDSKDEPIKEYQLTTVTYGTKSAPFLAMMTLKQLAADEKPNYTESLAADVLEQSFYMDDLLHGSHSIEAAKQLHDDLIKLLKSAGFNLRKWRSNSPEISDENHNQDNFNFKQAEYTKTLGLCWNPHLDVFTFQYKINHSSKLETKRSLLSDISKLFDPLGWLAPLSTKLKIIFQNVWLSNISWDDQLPENIKSEWEKVKQDINNIQKLQIPRWIHTDECHRIELHGFCDSSIKAYACVIYGKINSNTTLLVAKTRLVPIGKKISLPRLELSGALLLSRLMSKVKQCLSNYHTEVYGWSDSMVVLGWLNGDPGRWKTFVSNRVQEIINTMPSSCWRYIKSEHNPADCASRGITASQLIEHNLWWQGPAVLQDNCYKETQQKYITDQEVKKAKQVNVAETGNDIIYQLLSKYSSFNKITRILSWVLRFKYKPEPKQSFLSLSELRRSRNIIIKYVQENIFAKEIISLRDNNKLPAKSTIIQLNPFLDKNNILRVGGRLRNTDLDPEMKHPIIIPGHSRLAELLIDQSHKLTFHGGARLTSAFLRHKYWIVGGNNIVKNRLRGCVTCKRHDPVKHGQIMGHLPAARTTPTKPFHHTGVDYTGFVDIKINKGRGVKTSKGYIAVFVCMVTKAVHLELVSDLSSSSFLAALRRMSARRGTPRHIYSDNGTNFVGASRTINQEYFDLKSTLDSSFFAAITEMEIQWHFNAPSWPSAGGLWEAAVKSLKYHLKRVIGEQKLTFEEFSTLLAQLEACLNSRPLCALTEDPEDLNYLTPSHFLASGPTLTIIETERDHRTRWQLTQKIFDDIWKRWRIEYLSQLSARSKWRQPQANLNINDVVIIHDANLPAGKWALGRIIDLHPGKDGYVRVVSIKTKNSIVKRPVTKISRLPVNANENILTPTKPNQQPNQLKNESPESSTCWGVTTLKRPKKYVHFLFSVFMFLILLNTSVHGQYEVSNLKTTQGFYFDKITNMRLQRQEWKLVIYYDMNPYWRGTELLTKYINHLDNICFNTNRKIEQCDIILLQLHHGFTGLEHYNSILLGQQITRSGMRTRLRRGLINGVGYIANSLFGVLDEQFAEQYKNDIETVRHNERHLATLWKNQTSVVEAEFNLIKRVEDTMNKQHKIFNQHLNNLERTINAQGDVLQNIESVTEFTMSSIIANNMLANLQNIQETLIDTITNVYTGKLNYHLVPPEQLRDELNIIAGLLTKDLSLPLENNQSDLSKIYHLLSVRARASKQFIIFEVRIPLVSRDNFEIFKLIPIPQRVKYNAIGIVPVSEYVAVNIQKDSYIPMSERDIQKCMNYDFNTHLCTSKKPIYQSKIDDSLCKKDFSSEKCLTRSSVCKDTWTELNNVNNYLFFCCGHCTVRIICEHHIAAVTLRDAGIIALSDKCIIKGSTFTILAHKSQSNILNKEADIFKIEIPPINEIINLSIPVSVVENQSIFDNRKHFEDVNNQIKELKKASEGIATEHVSYHDVHHYVAIYLVVTVAAATGAAFLWRRCRAHTQSAHPATGQAEEAVVDVNKLGPPHPALVRCVSECAVNQCSEISGNNQCRSLSESHMCDSIKLDTSARFVNKSTSPVLYRHGSQSP